MARALSIRDRDVLRHYEGKWDDLQGTHYEPKKFYARIRKDRRYLPTWKKLDELQRDLIRVQMIRQYEAECDLAGRINGLFKPMRSL